MAALYQTPASTNQPYKGFVDISECSLRMGGKPQPWELLVSHISGYKVERMSCFQYSRFNLLIDDHFRTMLATLPNYSAMMYRIEMLFLLFRVTHHILQTTLPHCHVKEEKCYNFVKQMASPIHSDSDLEAILIQFCFAFPTDESIRMKSTILSKVWVSGDDYDPAVLLEIISLISCTRMLGNTSQNLDIQAAQNTACQSILSGLEEFHKQSGCRTSILFTKRHLNLSGRIKNNPMAPQFWYQCLLGRIAQIWLNQPPTQTSISVGKRKHIEETAIYDGTDPQLQLRHLDVSTTGFMMEHQDLLPPGLPMCLLVKCKKGLKENTSHTKRTCDPTTDDRPSDKYTLYREKITSYIATMEDLHSQLQSLGTGKPGRYTPQLPIQECASAIAASQHMLNMLDSSLHWDSTSKIAIPGNHTPNGSSTLTLHSQEDIPLLHGHEEIPLGLSQDLSVELNFTQNSLPEVDLSQNSE